MMDTVSVLNAKNHNELEIQVKASMNMNVPVTIAGVDTAKIQTNLAVIAIYHGDVTKIPAQLVID